jgi:hypothetical protein
MFSAGASAVDDVSSREGAVGVDTTTTGTPVSSAMGGSSTVVGASVACGAEEVSGTSVADGSTGALVATGSCVGGLLSDCSTGGGVLSSANTLIGKTIDDINENKTKTVKMASLLGCFIAKSPCRFYQPNPLKERSS